MNFPTKEKNRRSWHPLYQKGEMYAETIKIFFQMIVGVITAISLIYKVLLDMKIISWNLPLALSLSNQQPLEIVAYGLSISAGFELSYMLFTPGPDEAVEPVVVALAATVLLLTSKAAELTWQLGLGVLLLVTSIWVLVHVRRSLIADQTLEEREGEEEARSESKENLENGIPKNSLVAPVTPDTHKGLRR